jgi:ATP-dependent Clp protease ATP-binding subunit ClpA
VERFINQFPNIKIIVLVSRVDNLFQYFPLYFENQEPINNLLPEVIIDASTNSKSEGIKKVTQLSQIELTKFNNYLENNLIGHTYFKSRFMEKLDYFIMLNKVKEQKVFSVFLFGTSGIGKTEVARLIATGLKDDCYLSKINFQNYSSQDALNSLIGSPAGYVGCDHGELSDKINKSKVGIILFDEFEKATRPVFSFFLELLEEGRFTDSMAREYDLDGYILIFTSNIRSESEYKQSIPLELQTRFDLVCEFQIPTYKEKIEFLDLLLNKAKEKFPDKFSNNILTADEKEELFNFDISGLSALRDIKRVFNDRLMKYFNSKE